MDSLEVSAIILSSVFLRIPLKVPHQSSFPWALLEVNHEATLSLDRITKSNICKARHSVTQVSLISIWV